ncbi:MAG: hypothetical protein AAFV37_10945 [Pseudomonadota bacterium]
MRSIAQSLIKRGGLGRLVTLTWLGVYPVLTIIAVLLEPWLAPQALWLQTLTMSAIMVPVMVVGVMPALKRWL